MTTWVISDTHFGHFNIIRYCGRPFTTTHEMDEALIRNWNAVVKPTDDIYHLGDFSLCGPRKAAAIFYRLHGIKHLVSGNHDPKKVRELPWASVMKEGLIVDSETIGIMAYACHYPKVEWDRVLPHLHGHSHGNSTPLRGRLDVGVDCHNFAPITLARAVQLANEQVSQDRQIRNDFKED